LETLNVYFNQNLVGVLKLDKNRLFSFTYSPDLIKRYAGLPQK